MPRDVNGVYTLPLPAPVNGAPNVISSTWMNTTLNDIAAALTASAALPGSVTPSMFNNDQLGFQTKMGLDVIVNELGPRLAFLESCADDEIGDIDPFPFGTVPSHHLECNGDAVSRTTYADLFAFIGTTWGAGDGSTTFNLPDFRAEWASGSSGTRAVASWEDGQVVTHNHTGSTASTGAHTHTGNTASSGDHGHSASTDNTGAHTHTGSGTSGNQSANHTHTFSATTSSAGSHSHTTSWERGGHATSSGSSRTFINAWGSGTGKTTSAVGDHTHTIGGTTSADSATHNHAFSMSSSASGGHNHTVTVANSTSHTHTFTTSSNGDHSHTVTVDSTGGEARMRNVAVMFCIRFERG